MTEISARNRLGPDCSPRLVILAEPDIAHGDCKIEWADGGMVLERASIDAKINELVGRYMASRNTA